VGAAAGQHDKTMDQTDAATYYMCQNKPMAPEAAVAAINKLEDATERPMLRQPPSYPKASRCNI
jgi:hypothetical protein